MENIFLTIELVPRTSWFTNLRSLLSSQQWDDVRKKCYENASYKCEICGGRGDKWPVECHEVWEYDDERKIQKLVRTIALCPSCHRVKHIGLAKVKGYYKDAVLHFCKVNKCSRSEAEEYVEDCFIQWKDRSRHDWDIDVTWLDRFKSQDN